MSLGLKDEEDGDEVEGEDKGEKEVTLEEPMDVGDLPPPTLLVDPFELELSNGHFKYIYLASNNLVNYLL